MNDKIEMPYIFSDNMVLQRGKRIPVWGKSDQDVEIIFDEKSYSGKSKDGCFKLYLDSHAAASNLEMQIKSGDEIITYSNISVGEVWIAGGQSNMEWLLENSTDGCFDMQFADFGSNIRYFAAPHFDSEKNRDVNKNDRLGWCEALLDSGKISACAYYFAQRLYSKLGVPIGIIDCNLGATSILHWIPEEYLDDEKYTPYVRGYREFLDGKRISENNKIMGSAIEVPYGACFENHVRNICPYAAMGVIWYQGEADAAGRESAKLYTHAFETLVRSWREQLENSELRFISVLLAGYGGEWMGGSESKAWAYMRDAQIQACENTHTYYVSAVDRGGVDNIHPEEKMIVGQRLAGCALNKIYGMDIKWKCPKMSKILIEDGILKIYFEHTYGRLFASCREVCDIMVKDRLKLWYRHQTVVAEDHLEVKVGNIEVTKVRFCYCNNPQIRIYNKYGLPAVPFEYNFANTEE